jgi:predicted  nucleic acid-binding Zn-ribbon protein
VVLPPRTPLPNPEEPTLKADPFAQLKLLDIAELDSRIDQLRHQLGALPEHARIAELQRAHQGHADAVRDAQILVDDLTREQKKADADVEQVRARRERDRSRMDQGLISNPKDLERMSHELESLERRINDLEDAELEVMERLEEAQASLEQATASLAEAESGFEEATASRDQKAGTIHEDLAKVAAERGAAVEGMPEDLMSLYERIRTQKGVGAAALRARQCGGCRLTLNAADLAVIARAPSDEVVRCEECSRILVRTAESGL